MFHMECSIFGLPCLDRTVDVSRQILNGPRHAKTCLRAHAGSDGLNQPAHPRNPIKTFTVQEQNHLILQNVRMESKDADNTLRMRRII